MTGRHQAPRPASPLGALTWALGSVPAHTWAAVDTLCWRALVIPAIVYFRGHAIWVIGVSVATNLVAHLAARRAALAEEAHP